MDTRETVYLARCNGYVGIANFCVGRVRDGEKPLMYLQDRVASGTIVVGVRHFPQTVGGLTGGWVGKGYGIQASEWMCNGAVGGACV